MPEFGDPLWPEMPVVPFLFRNKPSLQNSIGGLMTKTTFKPGSLDTGTVNLSTGSVSFPISLASLLGRHGLDFDLSIHYSSGGIREIVDTWSVDAPTGVLGLGWSFPQNKIVRIWNGTIRDSTYCLFSGNTVYALQKGGVDVDGDIYESTNYQFWKIRYLPAHELWMITKEDGTCYFYGGIVCQTEDNTKTSAGDSIEWGVQWGTWTGPSNAVEKQEQFPLAWNLVRIEDSWGDQVAFSYEQDQQLVGTAGKTRKKYTQACRLSKVIGAKGETIVLYYGPNAGIENPYEKRVKRHTLPDGGPDAYQDRLERHYLDSLKEFNAKGHLVSQVQFRYASLGSGEMQKQILKTITRSNNQGHPYDPPRLFEYYGENSADGVSVSRKDSSTVAHGGALFGALKSMISPQGATTSYQYTELAIPNARRDLDIPRPGGEWLHPRAYLGLDYAVVVWRGTGNKLGKLQISVYQWLGRWVAASLAELTIHDTTNADSIQVEIAANFFAIITPGQAQTIHLFSKNPLSHGRWKYSPQNVGSLTDCLIASGTSFLALLDKSTGRLYCYTQDGENWKSSSVFDAPLKTGTGTIFGLTARNNYICTVSAVPNNAFQPELRLYSLDALGVWHSPILYNSKPFFTETSTSFKRLFLVGGTTFVSLLVEGVYKAHPGHSFPEHLLFVYRWTETAIQSEELDFGPGSASKYSDEARLAVVGDMMIVGPMGPSKVVYQYTGERWLSRVFENDSTQNNYLGSGSFSTTKNGQAQYWQFNPNTSQWDNGNIPPYTDGNPTLGAKIWTMTYWFVTILSLFASFQVGLLIDIALLAIDQFLASTPSGEFAGQDGERFFTSDNHVYYQDTTGVWSKIGELLTEEAQREKIVESGVGYSISETQQLEFQNTQAASNFIAYALTQNREKLVKGHSIGAPAGFPNYISKVQLLKNGAFFSSATTLTEKESLRRSPDDETSLIGWNAFLTFQGGKTLQEATSLKLYRVIQDDFQGPVKDDVVSRVSIHDGYEETHIHYEYDTASAEILSMGTTALYNKVTTVYSGASTTSNQSNGYTESYFYVGETTSLPNLPSDQTSTNSSHYPTLVAGLPYYTKVCDGNGRLIAATTQYWHVFQKTLRGHGNGYYLRQIKVESESDGSKKVVEQSYNHQYDLGNGFPDKTVLSNYDVTGHEERHETSYLYGWEIYPQLLDRHILAPVVKTTMCVNDIETANLATIWLPTPRTPFRLTPGRELPPPFQGAGWSVTGMNTVSAIGNRVLFPSTEQETLTAEIPPLTLIPNFSGKLLFTYDCTFMIFVGSTWAKLEVWVDGSRVWEVERANGDISEAVAIDLPQSYQRVEWRVVECRVEVPPHATDRRSPWVMVSVRDIRMPDMQCLAPAATYQAKKSQAPWPLNGKPEDTSLDWLKTSVVVARNPTFGLVTETQDVEKITYSVLYDTNYQFPVARFVYASIEGHEAGYYGFEDYENREWWQLTGTPEEDSFPHSGQRAYSGRDVRIEPRVFTPRTSAPPYIVSAWVKPRSGGNGGQIGFGNTFKQIAPGNNDWQYVEYVTSAPLADQKPFASCDGAIDDFRFGPVDAPFSATVYDPIYQLVTEQLGTNGETVRFLYDDLQTLIATTGPDGKEVSRLVTENHSRDAEKPFDVTKPNQKLSLLPRNGGQYYRTLSDYQGYKEVHRRYAGDPLVYVEQRVSPTTASYGFKLRVFGRKDSRSQPFFGIQFGNRIVLSDAPHRMILDQTLPLYASHDHPLKSFTLEHDPLDGSEWILLVLEQRAFFFLDGNFLFSETIIEQFVRLSVFWGPEESSISCHDVFLFSDPIVDLVYTDGLDRAIQTVGLDHHASGTIAQQILYDGWGHPAITTKPLYTRGISFAYQHELVKTFDWNTGQMTGKIVDYYRESILDYYREGHSFVIDQKLDDGLYPYSRRIAEANPLARISEVTQPGIDFKAGSPLTVRIDYGRTPEANALLADLNLAGKAEHYTLVTTRHPFDGHTRTVTTQLFDLQGTLVALRRGGSQTALTSTLHVAYASDGTRNVTSTQPNAFTHPGAQVNHQYTTTTDFDFQGHPQASTDSDRKMEQSIYDRAGRLCFKLDAEGASQSPHRILYWHYDCLGRILEEGVVRQEWNREQLQHDADVSFLGEASSPGRGAAWTRQYVYDRSANNTTTNLKGRLCEVRTRDEDMEEVRESFEYDLAGNVVSTQLVVEAFDTQIRGTRYEYDKRGNVTRIIYPYDLSGKPGFEVHYFYNTIGQISSIGTADDPSRYATYDYDIDGRIKTEHLNKQRLQRNYSYTIQGRLLSLQDRHGIFSEELRYRDAEGNFKDGNVVSAIITGNAVSIPYAYSYQYDEYGRLTVAQTVTAGYGIVPHPAWDVQGPDGHIEYDANGNLLHIKQGQTSSTYRYKSGTNQLESLLHSPARQHLFGFETHELDHYHPEPTRPMHLGDWYCKELSGGCITTAEKHSGTQSHQLGALLFCTIAVTPFAQGYRFTGWIKNMEENQKIVVCMKRERDFNGPSLVEQTIGNTNGQWKMFECVLPDAGNATQVTAYMYSKSPANWPQAVYVDDVAFGPCIEQEAYEHSQNGWITKNGKLDAVQYDPHAALPVDIRSGSQSTHFRYGGRRQRVLKTTDRGQNSRQIDTPTQLRTQRLYIHGVNAYPLTERIEVLDISGGLPTIGMETMYIYGPSGLVAVCEDGRTTSFFLKDHLGSTRVILDQENEPIATFHYLPFGSLLPDNGSQQEVANRFRYLYTGQEYDGELAIYNYRARMYESELGRFFTPDPKHQFPSPYVYVNNNPLNFVDPTGEMMRIFRMGMRPRRTFMAARGARNLQTGSRNGWKVRIFETLDELKEFSARDQGKYLYIGDRTNRFPLEGFKEGKSNFLAAKEPVQPIERGRLIRKDTNSAIFNKHSATNVPGVTSTSVDLDTAIDFVHMGGTPRSAIIIVRVDTDIAYSAKYVELSEVMGDGWLGDIQESIVGYIEFNSLGKFPKNIRKTQSALTRYPQFRNSRLDGF